MEFSKGVEQTFHNLTDDEQNAIIDYELMVYICDGNERERLDWFRTINNAVKSPDDIEDSQCT